MQYNHFHKAHIFTIAISKETKQLYAYRIAHIQVAAEIIYKTCCIEPIQVAAKII